MDILKASAIARRKSTNPSKLKDKYINGVISFDSPFYSQIMEHKPFLLVNSQKIRLEEKFKYRPDYVAYEYYGDTNLTPFIKITNGIYLDEEFDKTYIDVPQISAIYEVIRSIKAKNRVL